MKYFRVIKENFLWEVGAILKLRDAGDGYIPVDDIYKKHDGSEYITSKIVEGSPDYFERVYKVDLVTRVVYEVKDKAKEILAKSYKSE